MDWKILLACVTGSVDEELLLRNEYLATENRILRQQIEGRIQLTDAERRSLAEIGKKLSKQALEEIATIVKPETILAWHRKLVAQKFNGSRQRQSSGRSRVAKDLEDWVVKMAQENRSWGYDRIAGALADLGYTISDQTVGNILKRRGIPTAPNRKKRTTWREFIRSHMDVLWATDFFSAEVLTLGGLVTFYVLFFIKLKTREVHIAGMTAHPNEAWMMQVARNLVLYPLPTDNSRASRSGKIVLFHHHERGHHHGAGYVVLSPLLGCSRFGLRHRPCLVPRSSQGRAIAC